MGNLYQSYHVTNYQMPNHAAARSRQPVRKDRAVSNQGLRREADGETHGPKWRETQQDRPSREEVLQGLDSKMVLASCNMVQHDCYICIYIYYIFYLFLV